MESGNLTNEEKAQIILDNAAKEYAKILKAIEQLPSDKPLALELTPPGFPSRPLGTKNRHKLDLQMQCNEIELEATRQVAALYRGNNTNEVDSKLRERFFIAVEMQQKQNDPQKEAVETEITDKPMEIKESGDPAKALDKIFSLDYKLNKFTYGNENAIEYDKNKKDIIIEKD